MTRVCPRCSGPKTGEHPSYCNECRKLVDSDMRGSRANFLHLERLRSTGRKFEDLRFGNGRYANGRPVGRFKG